MFSPKQDTSVSFRFNLFYLDALRYYCQQPDPKQSVWVVVDGKNSRFDFSLYMYSYHLRTGPLVSGCYCKVLHYCNAKPFLGSLTSCKPTSWWCRNKYPICTQHIYILIPIVHFLKVETDPIVVQISKKCHCKLALYYFVHSSTTEWPFPLVDQVMD